MKSSSIIFAATVLVTLQLSFAYSLEHQPKQQKQDTPAISETQELVDKLRFTELENLYLYRSLKNMEHKFQQQQQQQQHNHHVQNQENNRGKEAAWLESNKRGLYKPRFGRQSGFDDLFRPENKKALYRPRFG
jgi:hypothetical protein